MIENLTLLARCFRFQYTSQTGEDFKITVELNRGHAALVSALEVCSQGMNLPEKGGIAIDYFN